MQIHNDQGASSEAQEDDVRKRREQSFHDARHGSQRDPRVVTRPFYAIVNESHSYYRALIHRDCEGRRILEYGCGPGSEGFELARRSAKVDGIDISPVAVQVAISKAAAEGLSGLSFAVMDAEHTAFEDASFDLVVGSGILHHLNLDRAYREIARVLKPSGRAVFIEPLGHNALINFYRDRTPNLRTRDEHPLLTSDFDLAQKHFKRLSLRYFHLSTLAAVILRRTVLFEPTRRLLANVDNIMFRAIPSSRKYAWMCVMEASK